MRKPQWLANLPALAALIAVNTFAVIGQWSWAYQSLGHDMVIAVGFAITLESISLYLTAMANAAMLANDKAGPLRLAAYGVGLLVGVMNYNAHSSDWSPNAMAIAFGILSMMSPILWGIWARRQHRDQLRAAGLIDPRTVKVPTTLWVLYPSYAFKILRLGVRQGENRLPELRAQLAEMTALQGLSAPDAVRYAFGALDSYNTYQARVWLNQRGVHVDQAALDAASAGRPPAVAPSAQSPALPVPVSPAPARAAIAAATPTVETAPAPGLASDVDASEYHRIQLASLASKRDQVRYAWSVLGEVNVPKAIRFLSAHGVTVSKSDAYALAKDAKTGTPDALNTPSGEYPAVPGQVLPFPTPTTNSTPHNGRHIATATARA